MPAHRFNQRKHGDRTQTRTGGRYDGRHKRARADAARHHLATNPCVRCHQPLGPMSSALHYDHDEHGGYLGFSHGSCNLRAGAIKGNTLQPGPHRPHQTTASYPIASVETDIWGDTPTHSPAQDPPATFFFGGHGGTSGG